jgi:hypothetical protein
LSEKLREGDDLEDQGLDGRVIIKLILERQGVKMWTDCGAAG